MFGPEIKLSKTFNSIVSSMWSNNGDALSFQYAGTGALKVLFQLIILMLHIGIRNLK